MLDLLDGDLRREIPTGPDTPSGTAQYLINGGVGIVAAGDHLSMLTEDGTAATWSRPDLHPAGRVIAAAVHGRPALVVPLGDSVAILDASNGSTIASRATAAGNPGIGGLGLVIATDQELLGWSPADGAWRQLVEALRADPSDVSAACAMLELAIQLEDRARCTQACEALRNAIAAATLLTEGAIESLLEASARATTTGIVPDAPLQSVFVALAGDSIPPSLQARARLLEAKWHILLGRSDQARAVLWSLIRAKELRGVMLTGDGAARGWFVRAPVEAGSRLAELVAAEALPWPRAQDSGEQMWIDRLRELERPSGPDGAGTPGTTDKDRPSTDPASMAESLREVVRIPCRPVAVRPMGEASASMFTSPSAAAHAPDRLLGWRAGFLESIDTTTGAVAWRTPLPGPVPPEVLATEGDRLVAISGLQVRFIDSRNGTIATEILSIDAILGAAPEPAFPPRGAPLTRGVSACTLGSTLVVARGSTVAALSVADGTVETRWRTEDSGLSIADLVPAGDRLWIIGVRGEAGSGQETVVRLADAATGATIGVAGGLPVNPVNQVRSSVVISDHSIVLAAGQWITCLRWWGDHLEMDWEVPGITITKATPVLFQFGGMVVGGTDAVMPARLAFCGTPIAQIEPGSPSNPARWISTAMGAIAWDRDGVWSHGWDGRTIGAASIPPGSSVRQCAVRGLAVAVLLESEAAPPSQPPRGIVPTRTLPSPRLAIGIMDLGQGLRWSGAPVSLPVDRSGLTPAGIRFGPGTLIVEDRDGYSLLGPLGERDGSPPGPGRG